MRTIQPRDFTAIFNKDQYTCVKAGILDLYGEMCRRHKGEKDFELLQNVIYERMKNSEIETITLTGSYQFSVSPTGILLKCGATDALKDIGAALQLYFWPNGQRGRRIILSQCPITALELQEDISHHGTPMWDTVKIISTDPKFIDEYFLFQRVLAAVAVEEAP